MIRNNSLFEQFLLDRGEEGATFPDLVNFAKTKGLSQGQIAIFFEESEKYHRRERDRRKNIPLRYWHIEVWDRMQQNKQKGEAA